MAKTGKPRDPAANAQKGERTKRALNDKLRTMIVVELACFNAPSEVARIIVEAGGPQLNTSSIVYYDPDTKQGATLHKKWVDLFRTTRKNFIDDTSRIAISHRSYRLARLERLARRLEDRLDDEIAKRNPVVTEKLVERIQLLMEQAAKDVGDAYTNRRLLIPGDPETELARELGITVEELRETLGKDALSDG